MPSTASLAGATRSDELGQEHDVWARADLVRRLRLALGIARRAVDLLAADGFRDDDDPEGSFGPDKPLAETAMLLYAASAITGEPEVKEQIDQLAAALAPHARAQRTAWAVALHPTISFQLAMPHVLLSRLGMKDPRFDRIVALSTESAASRGREVVPHRALERLWLESLWRDMAPDPSFNAAALDSVLNHPLDLLSGSREDAYAHTHTFMYFTDFGYSQRPLPRPRSDILGESASVLARSLFLEDFDLSAETLMAWPLTGEPWSPGAAFGFRVLAELEDTKGFLPAKNGTPEKYHRLEGAERTRYAVAGAYHTAYVMGMLCALALRPGNAPPAGISGPLVSADLIDELSGMIPDADTPWRHTFRRLVPIERRSLGPFLLDMALVSGRRNSDFATMATVLELAVRHDLANTPLCAQSAQLLDRVSACVDGAPPARAR